MRNQKICIGTGRIYGLREPVYYFDPKCYWAVDIYFKKTTTLFFNHLYYIFAGKTEEEGEKFWNKVKGNFAAANIKERQVVYVLFDQRGCVLAIGNMDKKFWIDCNDQFAKKTYDELNLGVDFDSLKKKN